MALAPEPHLSACLHVLYQASLIARSMAWGGEQAGIPPDEAKHLAVLMDSVHNIPELIANWERCDQDWLRRSLARYDAVSSFPVKLVDVYDRKLRDGGAA